MEYELSEITENNGLLEWWEKSVEYLFIAKTVQNNWIDLFCPLAGTPEKGLGDLIFQDGNKFILVEFKVDKGAWKDEIDKYLDFLEAEQKLNEMPGANAHFVVYGKQDRKPNNKPRNAKLSLHCSPYWHQDQSIEISSILMDSQFGKKFPPNKPWNEISVDLSQFREYTDALALQRQVYNVEDTESGTGAVSMTIAITSAGETLALTLPKYGKINPAPASDPAPTTSQLKLGGRPYGS